ncbi:methylated-DNA--[protein]-cysteine S-methyltransferase [Moraxella sp.]|uniref:methylated-DNA--[protein]-cysteine S-methyltransferase n=1 Tax=Moraxella sp. TaxID=479 RepID=UPI002639FB09|nr:methylated-DNA--[protein]-cysteine S-methyltransferase [Moraxella sp.]MCP3897960.1 methylated-DNA--[protein]-cysteine S-methyltransferase [Moraxella sp.]
MVYLTYESPFDLPMMVLCVHEGRLRSLHWQNEPAQARFNLSAEPSYLTLQDLKLDDADHVLAHKVVTQLDEYFAGKRRAFDVPLDLSCGTPFQQQVWRALYSIPYNETISYKTLATMIDKPTAYRACANANGKNPISLIVPCHRVIAADGSIGGYTGGIEIKEVLLGVEKGELKYDKSSS